MGAEAAGGGGLCLAGQMFLNGGLTLWRTKLGVSLGWGEQPLLPEGLGTRGGA